MPSFHPARYRVQQSAANWILALRFIAGVEATKVVDGARLASRTSTSTAFTSIASVLFPSLALASVATAVSGGREDREWMVDNSTSMLLR